VAGHSLGGRMTHVTRLTETHRSERVAPPSAPPPQARALMPASSTAVAAAPPIQTPSESRRIPSLDGIRTVSILLVIGWHLSSSGSAPWFAQLWRIDSGNLGVRTFFVISGYLITSLLLAEYARTGTIDLRRFYLRRAFRIMPAFYVFLIVMALAAAFGVVEAPRSSLIRATTYTANYATHTAWTVGHTWSPAVEEQFYLLWPGLIVLLGLRRSFIGAAFMLLLSPSLRTVAILSGRWPDNPRYAFECVADALATGCLFAYARPWLWNHALYRRMLERREMAFWPLVIAALAAASVRWERLGAIAGISLINIAIALWIDWCLRFPDSWVGRILNARPIAFIGVLSYSIYLWQQPFLREGHALRFPLSILCIGAVAIASYHVIERPMLRLRARLKGTRK
jgi:peptidoglycan/LPS O-acetylase OafA/YrhL